MDSIVSKCAHKTKEKKNNIVMVFSPNKKIQNQKTKKWALQWDQCERIRMKEIEQKRKEKKNTEKTAHKMMKTDTMQFQLILLMRLTRNKNLYKPIWFIRRGRQIKLRHITKNQTNKSTRKKKLRSIHFTRKYRLWTPKQQTIALKKLKKNKKYCKEPNTHDRYL